MPKTTFSTENKIQDASTFPVLKLTKDERARILCIETEPEFQYAHTLRAPKIINGKPEMKQMERKNGEKYEDFDLDFIGMPTCLGDIGILQERGVDPQNCPICAESVKSDIVAAPQRRFAMHVLRYGTRPGGFVLTEPYSVSVIVWRFTDVIFNKLTDFAEEWGSLQRHDLLLGPCTNPQYQKYEITIAQSAEWLKSDERKAQAVLAYKENRAPDLAAFCGRKSERRWIEEDLTRVRARFEQARSFLDGAPATPGRPVDLAAGLDDLLSQSSDSAVPADVSEGNPFEAAVDESTADFRELVGTEPPVPEAPQAPEASQDALNALLTEEAVPAAAAPTAPAPPSGDVVDFDALLAGLEDS